MDVTLCMLVKNERHNLEACLGGLGGAFEKIVVADTGSSDGSVELLRDSLGIEPLRFDIDEGYGDGLDAARNFLLEQVRTPWVLMLDADERLSAETVRAIHDLHPDADVEGYFGPWRTVHDGIVEDDYKLSLFRRECRYLGAIHCTVQPFLRRQNKNAVWWNGLEIRHEPSEEALRARRIQRLGVLKRAIHEEPHWLRHHWFLGYTLFRQGCHREAVGPLAAASNFSATDFPVEALNSAMILAVIHAHGGDMKGAQDVLSRALRFHDRVESDFEVRVNTRMRPWLSQALGALDDRRFEQVVPYAFAY